LTNRGSVSYPERPGERGAAYVLALTALVVGLTLALALLRASNANYLREASRLHVGKAKYIAEAGVEFEAWQLIRNHCPVPHTADIALAGGSFHATAVDDSAREPGCVLVTSVGTAGGSSYTAKRVIRVSGMQTLPYDYAWCQDNNLSSGDAITITSATRGMAVNGTVSLSSSSNNITTGVWAQHSITASGTVTPRFPNSSRVVFSGINYAYYESIATRVCTGSTTFTNADLTSAQPQVILVNGDLILDCTTYTGMFTVVAAGTVSIKHPIAPADQDSFLAVLTNVSIDIDSSASSVAAILYAHRSSSSATIQMHAAASFTGSVDADITALGGSTTFASDPRLTRYVHIEMQLPGL